MSRRNVFTPFTVYLRLLRIANLPTVWSNTLCAAWLAAAYVAPPSGTVGVSPFVLAPLLLAGSAFYLAGMVLNDYYDLELDRVERPERPLPSGKIAPRTAWILGMAFMTVGLAASAALTPINPWCPVFGGLLAVAVFTYDAGLKSTFLGPVFMGLCRALNAVLALVAVLPFTMGIPLVLLLYPLWLLLGIALVTGISRFEVAVPPLQTLVGVLLLGLIPVDALICLFALGPLHALIIVFLFPVPWFLRRVIPPS